LNLLSVRANDYGSAVATGTQGTTHCLLNQVLVR
jgi:hypothetical protein